MPDLHSTIEAALRHGIWRITIDGRFYGDYRSRTHATEAVEALALKMRAEGRKVDVAWAASAG